MSMIMPGHMWQPIVCVWEVTLDCNMACSHCGSSAGQKRPYELNTDEALKLIHNLGDLGCKTITLSGGEPLLRDDWPTLVRAIHKAGIRPELITNGLAVSEQADAIKDADFFAISFSIDGPAKVHDSLRNTNGAMQRLLEGAYELKKRKVRLGAVTQVNKRNLDSLEETYQMIVNNGFAGWQIQLTLPLGRAAGSDNDICLNPKQLLTLEKKLIPFTKNGDIFVQTADTIGYFSKAEPRFRAGLPGNERLWAGCLAGLRAIGITSDGTVRGCLSMPPEFDEGNVRNRPLKEIWNSPEAFAYNRKFTASDLNEACAACAFSKICKGGCTTLSNTISQQKGCAEYCLHYLAM
jgi:radical SAM protein with 4Fe4S-binding SPASM domain